MTYKDLLLAMIFDFGLSDEETKNLLDFMLETFSESSIYEKCCEYTEISEIVCSVATLELYEKISDLDSDFDYTENFIYFEKDSSEFVLNLDDSSPRHVNKICKEYVEALNSKYRAFVNNRTIIKN